MVHLLSLFLIALACGCESEFKVPTISISEFVNGNISVQKSIALSFDTAMKEHGFFYLDINNISEDIENNLYLLSSIYDSSSSFFNRSLEYKLAYSGLDRGASGYQSPYNETAAFKELIDDQNDSCHCADLNENFRWRPRDNNNNEYVSPQEFRHNNILNLYSSFLVNAILPKLHRIASMALNLSNINYFETNIYNTKPWSIAIRINHYYPNNDTLCRMRLGAHCDYVGFTLLLIDDVSGLQGMNKNGIWYDILSPNQSNVLIVNAGELIERGTNGYWLAAKHRVIQNDGNANKSRISVALFSGPNGETLMGPFANCDVCNKDAYKYGDMYVTVQQHVINRLKDLGLANPFSKGFTPSF